jgi:hypothetical protein
MRSGSGRPDELSRAAGRALRALLVVGFAAMSVSCSSAEGNNEEDTPSLEPGCEGRGEAIVLDMTKTSDDGELEVSLLAADPLPPVQGENSWTVEVTLAGEPVVDAGDADAQVIANVYMAEHDHNIRKRGTMTSPGVFEFARFPITMNGYWEVTVQVQSDADATELTDTVFGFCVQN